MAKLSKITDPSKIDLATKSNEELFLLRVQLEKEFKKREIKFTVGDVGERIAIDYFNHTPGLDNLLKAPTGTKNVDALSRKGERYSIKTIKDGNKSGTVYPDNDKQLFEYLILIVIDDDYVLKSLHRFSWLQFLQIRQWDKTMNAWYVPKTQKALDKGECIYKK